MLPQMPGQRWATNNGRGYCSNEGTLHVSTQEKSKGMVAPAGARHSSLFIALVFALADAALRMSFFEAADADAITTSDADWRTPDASRSLSPKS